MATPRKPEPAKRFGPKVEQKSPGRPRAKVDAMQAVARRLAKVLERFRYDRGKDVEPDLGHYSRATFAERIGISESRLYQLLTWKGSAGFSIEAMINVCQQFRVRPQYLLLGEEPMLLMDESGVTKVSAEFSDLLSEHMVAFLAVSLDAEPKGVKRYLPRPRVLMRAVERGIEDAWREAFDAHVADAVLAAGSIQLAVASKVRAKRRLPSRSRKAFKALVKRAEESDLLVLTPSGAQLIPKPKTAKRRSKGSNGRGRRPG